MRALVHQMHAATFCSFDGQIVEALCNAQVRLGGAGIQLAAVVLPQRLGVAFYEGGDFRLLNAEGGHDLDLMAMLVGWFVLGAPRHANTIKDLEAAATFSVAGNMTNR